MNKKGVVDRSTDTAAGGLLSPQHKERSAGRTFTSNAPPPTTRRRLTCGDMPRPDDNVETNGNLDRTLDDGVSREDVDDLNAISGRGDVGSGIDDEVDEECAVDRDRITTGARRKGVRNAGGGNRGGRDTDERFKDGRDDDERYGDDDERYGDDDEKYGDDDERYGDADERYKDADEKYKDADERYEDADERYKDSDERYQDADERYKDGRNTGEGNRDGRDTDERCRDGRNTGEGNKDGRSTDERCKDGRNTGKGYKDGRNTDGRNTDGRNKGGRNTGERNKDGRNKDGRNKDGRNKDERSKDERSKDERSKDERSKDEKNKVERSKDERSKDERSGDGRNKDEKSRDGRNKDERSRDGKNKDERPKDGKNKDERPKEGKNKDERPRDGRYQDGTSKDEITQIEITQEKRMNVKINKDIINVDRGNKNVSKEDLNKIKHKNDFSKRGLDKREPSKRGHDKRELDKRDLNEQRQNIEEFQIEHIQRDFSEITYDPDELGAVGIDTGSSDTGGFNLGSSNTGGFNLGRINIGELNTGVLHTGGLDTGGLITGGLITGGLDTGGLNTGGLHTGVDIGGLNTGDLNTNDLNTGGFNIGSLNIGDLNTGDLNTEAFGTGTFDTNLEAVDLGAGGLAEADLAKIAPNKQETKKEITTSINTRSKTLSIEEEIQLMNKTHRTTRKIEKSPAQLESDEKDIEYLRKLIKCLKEEDITGAKTLIRDKNNAQLVTNAIWSIIPLVINFVNYETMEEQYHMYEGCVKILKNVSKIAEAEDLVLCLLQEMQQTKDDETFLSILKPLQTAILRLPKKRSKFYIWTLHSIWKYLTGLPTPINYYLEEEERMLMDVVPIVDRVSTVYFEALPFYDPLVIEFQKCQTKEQAEIKQLLICYMTNSLDKPFAYLDLAVINKTKSRARRSAERVVEDVTKLMPDFYKFLEFRTDESENKIVKDLPLGVFFYLCLCEKLCCDCAPRVYHPVYVFQNCWFFVVALLNADSQFSVERGLALAEVLLESVHHLRLPYLLLDSYVHSSFCKIMAHITIFNSQTETRKRSLNVFNKYLYSFDNRGRYLLIYNLMHLQTSPNVIAYLIAVYKDMFQKEIDGNEKGMSKYFSGYKLLTLLKLFCYLHQKEESDLIELSDQIIAVLNFLWYMAMRDKNNASKIWDYVKELNEIFMEPLKKGILLSRVHYQARIKDVSEEKTGKNSKKGDGKKGEGAVSVTIGGIEEDIKNMPVAEKLFVLKSSLTTFDVMDSVLCSLNETIERRKAA